MTLNQGHSIPMTPATIVPRITIGIPTHDRPEMLCRAVRSALDQTVPVRVLVSHDGDDAGTARALHERFPADMEGGRLNYHPSGTAGLWANWDATARCCRTDFFLWLQDDDILMPYVAARVASAFDAHPECDLWMAPNKLGLDERYHWWNNGNGPWVPLRTDGLPEEWESEIFAPTCYFLAWSLSPGVAFRRGPRFDAMLDAMPMDCEVFAERLVLTGMGRTRFVVDPAVAGVWIQHAGNQCRKSHADQPRQSAILVRELDAAMDRLGDGWREAMATWCRLQHPQWITGWMGDLEHVQEEGGRSRHAAAIRDVMFDSLHGRVRFMPRYRWWRRAINWAIGKAAL